MFFLRHLNAFVIYIFFLIVSAAILINAVVYFPVINIIVYLFIHMLMIYIGIYHFKRILYLIFFISGIVFDIFLINEIGPHLITFMILIILLKYIKKFIISFNIKNIFITITIILFFSLFCEMCLSLLLFNFDFIAINFLKYILIFLLISFPTFFLFSKIDKFG